MAERRDLLVLLARACDEDPGGTASRQRCWLLIEQPGAWGRNALLESKLPNEVAQRPRAGAGGRRCPRAPDPPRSRRRGAPTQRRWVFVRATADGPAMGGGWFDDPSRAPGPRPRWPRLGRRRPVARRRPGPAHRRLHPRAPRPCCADNGRPVARAPAPGGGRRLGVLPRRRGPVRGQRGVVPARPVPRPGDPGDGVPLVHAYERGPDPPAASGAGPPGHRPSRRPRSCSATSWASGTSRRCLVGHDHDRETTATPSASPSDGVDPRGRRPGRRRRPAPA